MDPAAPPTAAEMAAARVHWRHAARSTALRKPDTEIRESDGGKTCIGHISGPLELPSTMKEHTMQFRKLLSVAGAAAIWICAPGSAVTDIQVGATGKTYASAGMRCAVHPTGGMSPMVQAGLYNPKKSASATVSLNGTPEASVTFLSPDATVWLANGVNAVTVELTKKSGDTYSFDATPTFAGQPNVCIPDTRNNLITGDLEYSASGKSYATVTPGCAWNARTGRAEPYVNLFDNGAYLLNVSVNNLALTQLSVSRTHTPVFLSAGWNVISAANGALSTDYYVRDGGSGTCTLP
jgi:hypothetical protein